MSNDLIKYAFVAGEVSPTLFGRSDLEKYDLGLALARNFFVDYRGGISSRMGSEFVDYVQHDDQPTKFVPFKFAPNLANTNIVLFGEGYIRFLQDGAYVLEDAVALTGISQASPGVVTSVAHGMANGDWVYLDDVVGMTQVNGKLFEVAGVTANDFQLLDPFGANYNTTPHTAYSSGGNIYRVYTLASPYLPEDLAVLKAYQRRDLIRLTHPDYKVRNLIRNDTADWDLDLEVIGNLVSVPTGLVATPSAAGVASVGFTVTAVVDGEESLPAIMLVRLLSVDYASTAGSMSLVWTAVPNAQYYNVYRTVIQSGAGAGAVVLTRASEVGFLGRAYAPHFIDTNIIPDFTLQPPRYDDPFADGAIDHIEITAPGAGYTAASTMTVSGGSGAGFEGYPIVSATGTIIGAVITNRGHDYTAPVVAFSVGAGATATATLGETDGNDPSVSAIFQQRQIYAATLNQPLTVFGSQPGRFSNFDVSAIVAANDAFEFDIESEEVAPISHLTPTRGGLLTISQSGIWMLRNGSTDEAITPTQALADPQSYRGCSAVPPLNIDTDLLYIEGKSPTVRLLSYNDFSKVYAGQDMSILSNHLFSPTKQIIAWAYAQNPFNLVMAIRSDGALLIFTLVKEQDVYAWTQSFTKGLYQDITVVQENDVDAVYVMVKRYINGRWTKFIERLARREFDNVEEAWCVDCGLRLVHTYPAAVLTPHAAEGTGVEFETDVAIFVVGDVDKIIRVGGGKARVVTYVSPTQVYADILRPITALIPEDSAFTPLDALSGEWTMDATVDEISVPHLIGEEVAILADGNVIEGKTVDADGMVALERDATEIVVGLKYTCIAKTLPPTASDATIEAKRKRIVGTAIRVHDTVGLKQGISLDNLYEMKDRTTEDYGEPTSLQRKNEYQLIEPQWTEDAQVFYVQDRPLPATILGLVSDLEVGDDSR